MEGAWVEVCMNGRRDGWVDGWTDGWMEGGMDGWGVE